MHAFVLKFNIEHIMITESYILQNLKWRKPATLKGLQGVTFNFKSNLYSSYT